MNEWYKDKNKQFENIGGKDQIVPCVVLLRTQSINPDLFWSDRVAKKYNIYLYYEL